MCQYGVSRGIENQDIGAERSRFLPYFLAHWAEVFKKNIFSIYTYISIILGNITFLMFIYNNIPNRGQKPELTFLRYLLLEFLRGSDFGN